MDLWTHVQWSAENGGHHLVVLTYEPTEPEISYFVYFFAFDFFVDQNILWFDISVNDNPIFETTHHILEPIDQLFEHIQYLV